MPCLARECAGPRQPGLVGERPEKNLRTVSVSRPIRQFQTCAPLGRHRLLHAEHLKRRTPPPCRSRRSRLLRNRAPSSEFAHRAFELHIRSLLHWFLQTTDDTRLWNCGQCELRCHWRRVSDKDMTLVAGGNAERLLGLSAKAKSGAARACAFDRDLGR